MNWLRRLSSRLHQSREAQRAMAHRAGHDRTASPLRLEALEPRVLLSADPVTSVSAGVLSASFGGDDDVVDIRLGSSAASADGGVIVDLQYNGSSHLFGTSSAGITGVVIKAGAGNDRFTLESPLQISLTIDGESGDDTLRGGAESAQWLVDGAGSGSRTRSPASPASSISSAARATTCSPWPRAARWRRSTAGTAGTPSSHPTTARTRRFGRSPAPTPARSARRPSCTSRTSPAAWARIASRSMPPAR